MDTPLEPPLGHPQEDEAELLALFPVPTEIEGARLVEALLRVYAAVPWLQTKHGGEPYRQSLEAIERSWKQAVPAEQQNLQYRALVGDYDAAGLMVGNRSSAQPKGLQTLRGLFWIVARQKYRRHISSSAAAQTLAQALRNTNDPTSNASDTLNALLPRLAASQSLTAAIENIASLKKTSHGGLTELFHDWLLPPLRALDCGSFVPTKSPPGDVSSPPSPARPRKKALPKDEAEELVETDDGTVVRPLIRTSRPTGLLHHEPLAEFSTPTFLVDVGSSEGALHSSVQRFYAQRAIWTGNGSLLTHHVDAVLPDVYGLVMRNLVEELAKVVVGSEVAIGTVGCLLKALTSRTSAGLKAFRVAPSGHDGQIDGGVLDPDAGLIWLPVFWKIGPESTGVRDAALSPAAPVGYFRPTPLQQRFLAPTLDRLALPMPTPVRNSLRAHAATLRAMVSTDIELLNSAISVSLAKITRKLAVPVTVGGLRRSLGPLVMEHSRDPAMAQLICGESLGLTTAPQNYYAPRLKDVAESYRGTMAEHFGSSPLWRIPASASRVGSELMVTLATARAMAASSACNSPNAHPELASVLSSHRGMADHLARMILATSGHRPSEALFEITLADIDLDSGAALFRDKRHDIAHDPRLACLPRVLIEQIRAYIEHLRGLMRDVPALADSVGGTLRGTGPLLFDLSDAGEMVRAKLADVVARSPNEWRELPWNWSRTWIRTTAVQAGAPPFLIAAQLGHFDSVGYPYSNQSPTVPLEVVRRTQPWLDKLAKRQGWAVRHSDLAVAQPGAAAIALANLRDWSPDIERQEVAGHAAQREWERRLKVDRRALREQALHAVLSHPAFVLSGLAAAEADPEAAVAPEAIESLDVEATKEDLVLECGDDAIAAASRIRALKQVIRRLAKRAQVGAPALPVPIPVRRPLDNPFFQGACRGLSQLTALREHVRQRAEHQRPQRTFELQVARTAESLVLFGGVDNASDVLAILAARSRVVRSSKLDDLLLVPLDDARCYGLRGIAAIALLALGSEFPEQQVPGGSQIDAALLELLPEWATCTVKAKASLLALLCSTVAVSNRFEYSSAARFALDRNRGSMHSSPEEQMAFVDADVVGPVRIDCPVSESSPHSGGRSGRGSEGHARDSSARKQYDDLRDRIPKKGKSLVLPTLGLTIPATAIHTEPTRNRVIDELRAWLAATEANDALWPVVHMLAKWTLSEAERRLPNGKRLADRTVETYLSRIGLALVRMLGTPEAMPWDEQQLEDAYAYALEASDASKHKVAAALLSFHTFCEKQFDLPDADLSVVYAALRDNNRHVDASMILPCEREAAFAALAKGADSSGDEASTRRARVAEFVGVCLGRTGARLSEPLGFRVNDVARRPSGGMFARIVPNRMRPLKTRSGRRVVLIDTTTQPEKDRLWSWCESVRRHAPPGRSAGAYLTAELEDPRAFREHPAACEQIRRELARATGRATERLHRLRHLAAQEALLVTSASSEDAEALGLKAFAGQRVLEPRDFAAISVPLGHWHWITTLQCYLHVPWVLQSRTAAHISKEYFGRQAVAGALGYTSAFLDNLLREGAGSNQMAAWFNRFGSARVPPAIRGIDTLPSQSPWRWTARRVAKLLTEGGRSKDLLSAAQITGMPIQALGAFTASAERWERKLGRRLLPEHVEGRRRHAPGRALKRLQGDAALEVLWDRFDSGEPMARSAIARLVGDVYAELQPAPGERLRLPQEEADRLRDLLQSEAILAVPVLSKGGRSGTVQLGLLGSSSSVDESRTRLLGIRRVLAVIGIAVNLQEEEGKAQNPSSP